MSKPSKKYSRFFVFAFMLVILTICLIKGREEKFSYVNNGFTETIKPIRNPRATEAIAVTSYSPFPSFPNARGYGAQAVGGRGGRIIAVVNLNDSGPGSLRAAVEAEGPRTVIFKVAGIIEVDDSIHIKDPFLTIAGQTAPGDGITIKGGNDHIFRLEDGVHDVIIRYLRFRHGSGKPGDNDNLNIRGGNNIIIDHVSMSWSTDENVGIYRDNADPPNYNITIQRSIMAEGLAGQSNGMQISGVQDYSNPDAPIEAWRKNDRISIHHNLFIHNTHRNSRIIADGVKVTNNIVYNWKYRIGSTRSATRIDYINNYFKNGPMSNIDYILLHENCSPDHPDWICPLPDPSIYISGNIALPEFPDPTNDNWGLLATNWTFEPLPSSFRRMIPLPSPDWSISVQSANDAYDSVLADVGANARLDCEGAWVSNVDIVDSRLLNDVVNNSGPEEPISSPDAVGGFPLIDPGTPCLDRDNDGMPDAWEIIHNLDPEDGNDGPKDFDFDGYTNLEEFLNGTPPDNLLDLIFLPAIQSLSLLQ